MAENGDGAKRSVKPEPLAAARQMLFGNTLAPIGGKAEVKWTSSLTRLTISDHWAEPRLGRFWFASSPQSARI